MVFLLLFIVLSLLYFWMKAQSLLFIVFGCVYMYTVCEKCTIKHVKIGTVFLGVECLDFRQSKSVLKENRCDRQPVSRWSSKLKCTCLKRKSRNVKYSFESSYFCNSAHYQYYSDCPDMASAL